MVMRIWGLGLWGLRSASRQLYRETSRARCPAVGGREATRASSVAVGEDGGWAEPMAGASRFIRLGDQRGSGGGAAPVGGGRGMQTRGDEAL